MAVYKIFGTFGKSFSNGDEILLFADPGAIVPASTTKFELEQGILVTVENGASVTAYASNGDCANISFSLNLPVIPEPGPTEEFTCVDANFNVADGTAGDSVTGTVSGGTLSGITPSIYSENVTTYTASILIPEGYTNTGDGNQYISCTDTAVVTPAATPHLYYTFDPCAAGVSVDVLLASSPITDERRIDPTDNNARYTYSGSPGGATHTNTVKSLDATGATGCTDPTPPTPPTPTPPPTYYYIAVRECNDYNSNGALNDRVVRSLTDITGWSHVLIPRYSGDTNAVYQKYGNANQYDLEIAYNAGTYDLPPVDLDSTASSNGVTVASLERNQCS